MKKMTPDISMATYKPDPKAINQALWGRDDPPDEKSQKEDLAKMAERMAKLKRVGLPEIKP